MGEVRRYIEVRTVASMAMFFFHSPPLSPSLSVCLWPPLYLSRVFFRLSLGTRFARGYIRPSFGFKLSCVCRPPPLPLLLSVCASIQSDR